MSSSATQSSTTTMNTPTSSQANIDSLEYHLNYFVQNKVDDDTIYDFLSTRNLNAVNVALKRLQAVEKATKSKESKKTVKSFNSQKNSLKGKLFEHALLALFKNIRPFTILQNRRSATNELDLHITLGPTSLFSPVLKEWGTSMICECKYRDTYIMNDWVSKFTTVLNNHNTKIGYIASKKGIAPTGPGTQIKTVLSINAAKNIYISCISVEDLSQVVADNVNPLKFISSKYNDCKALIYN